MGAQPGTPSPRLLRTVCPEWTEMESVSDILFLVAIALPFYLLAKGRAALREGRNGARIADTDPPFTDGDLVVGKEPRHDKETLKVEQELLSIGHGVSVPPPGLGSIKRAGVGGLGVCCGKRIMTRRTNRQAPLGAPQAGCLT